jgi:hypothetical protein
MANPNYKPKIATGSGIHSIKARGGELIHIDLNSHNACGNKSKTGDGINFFTGKEQRYSMNPFTGGELVHDFMNTQTSNNPIQTPRFTEYKIKSTNPLFHNIKTSDIRDLKGLFKQVEEKEANDKATTLYQGKATKSRVKKDVKKVKSLVPRNIAVRGSPANKALALERYKLKNIKRRKFISI